MEATVKLTLAEFTTHLKDAFTNGWQSNRPGGGPGFPISWDNYLKAAMQKISDSSKKKK